MAYFGPNISLSDLLYCPEHNLIVQSWSPKEMDEATLNADGFGFAWYLKKGHPATYTSTQPIWADHNLSQLSKALTSPIWLANVRSATYVSSIGRSNTQPFMHKKWLFMHNGYIFDFLPRIKTHFHRILKPSIQADIVGNTDSEYLFALFRQIRTQYTHTADALKSMLTSLHELLSTQSALLNFILCDGEHLYACRYAINKTSPTLYISTQESFSPGGTIISSERLTVGDQWEKIAENSLLILSMDALPIIQPL